ncbi:hypothetical protein M409DRAFT_66495 [Zasmidium cellare ATCC 36951]|uniref:FAD/NAD(P)-binding domain-containing protein n=1 Tax=Zasmidium cellare ATCC 36951 TaxID=1080233 RepID=A0A6A6CGN4_ZASCE|nr:uncharacterized protein M409DRAFT_66495 [Zasmidium cellare ATCC 36951]KAF2166407.1 hypothetical protein M409DRAFT_66495 [Zasmidium cellare ATCC 36951]
MGVVQELDAVVVGTGFGGIYMTKRFKDAGFRAVCLEKAPQPGGVWHWNCYPGARVDSRYPVYQYTDPKLNENWTWEEAFPGYGEIRKYLKHTIQHWNLAEQMVCGAEVVCARFDETAHKWTITCADGRQFVARWFINSLGFATQPYVPKLPGLETFKGPSFHSARWPQDDIDVRGKRVAVIGTGASAVQIIQTIASEVSHMTVYQRTPSVCLPLRQQKLSKAFQDDFKTSGEMAALQHECKYKKFGGQNTSFVARKWANDTPEERRQVFEDAWAKGGFHPLLSTYFDVFVSHEVNSEAWRFWAEKSRERIKKPEYRDILAPLEPVHTFGGKRTPMEIDYFEAFNHDHVSLVDIKADPIVEVTPTGIRCAETGLQEFDIIVLATGFDTNTGALTAINIVDTNGQSLKQRWEDGVYTRFGLSTSGFPNMWYTYGPQAPTAFSNGPSCVELQGEFIFDLIKDMGSKGITRIETSEQAEQAWRQSTLDLWSKFVVSATKGYYCGVNIPGKKEEPLNWFGGLHNYHAAMTKCREEEYEGFIKS